MLPLLVKSELIVLRHSENLIYKGRYGINHGLLIQSHAVKTFADCEQNYRLSRNLQTVKTVAECQYNFIYGVSESMSQSISESVDKTVCYNICVLSTAEYF